MIRSLYAEESNFRSADQLDSFSRITCSKGYFSCMHDFKFCIPSNDRFQQKFRERYIWIQLRRIELDS